MDTKPPAKMNSIPWDSELTVLLAQNFGPLISEFSSYLGQNFLVAEPQAVRSIVDYLKVDQNFDFLVDVTAVDYLKDEKRFELLYNLYSFERNERVRIKTRLTDGQIADSLVSVHPTANWLEREVYDMFGIEFEGHPNLRRILMPDDWRGYPLRKDYSILQMDNRWVQENLGIESGQ